MISLAFSKISQLEIPSSSAAPVGADKTRCASLRSATLLSPSETYGAVVCDRLEVGMSIDRVSNHNQMDCNFDNMESKQGKLLPCQEDRFDSGVDSLREDELTHSFDELTIKTSVDRSKDYEPWRSAVTEDGDT